jgi:hypothetical protein
MLLAQGDGKFGANLSALGIKPLDVVIPLVGAVICIVGWVLARRCRPGVLSACFLLVPLPVIISCFAVIDLVDRSTSSSDMTRALLTFMLGVASSVPAYLVISRGVYVSYEETGANRR